MLLRTLVCMTHFPFAAPRTTWIEVSADALVNNLHRLQTIAGARPVTGELVLLDSGIHLGAKVPVPPRN